jgi:hypothetical protein
MMVILLIVLLLFGAKNFRNSHEEWAGQSRSSAPPEMRLKGNSCKGKGGCKSFGFSSESALG